MILVELDKYAEENNYKQPANNPNAASPDNITHARLYYNTFAGSNYIQGSFVPGSNSSVEFDDDGVTYTKYKLFVSTDGTTYTERKSFGGTDGKDCITSQHLLSPLGITNWYLPVKKSQGGNDVVVFDSLSNIITGAGVSVTATGVNYLYCRGVLSQHNSVESGKAFFGSTIVASDTGIIQANIGTPEVTIADSFSRTMSSKISTGIYALQFRTNNANNFVASLAGFYQYKFEPRVYTVWGSRQVDFVSSGDGDVYYSSNVPGVKGYLVIDNKEYFTGYSQDEVPVPQSTGYYQAGKVIVKTYNSSWVLADNIIEQGITIEFRAFESLSA